LPKPDIDNQGYNLDDFTERHYNELLLIAKKNYSFISYRNYKQSGKVILWRHDLDLSVHRAYQLSVIEKQVGVNATYFLDIHSKYYNIFEKEVYDLVRGILLNGHEVGLHFDPSFYSITAENVELLQSYVNRESRLLESFFGTKINALSFHNPEIGGFTEFSALHLNNLVNAYSSYLQHNYSYVSDSNGYWRFRRLYDVLEEGKEERLQVLTHPGWYPGADETAREDTKMHRWEGKKDGCLL